MKKKKMISFLSITALTMAMSATAFASQGTVERSVHFRSGPSTSSAIYQTLSPGTHFEVLNEVNRYWLKVNVNGKVGYVSPNYVSVDSGSQNAIGSGTVKKSVNFRSAPSTGSTVYRLLRTGTNFKVLEKVNAYWLKIEVNGQTGYVSTGYVNYSTGSAPTPPPTPQPSPAPSPQPTPAPSRQEIADRIIEHGKALEGITHYSYGVNRPPSVMDCSAFVKYVFGQEGISLKWGTRYQKDAGTYVSRSNLQKGDLVFFWIGSKGQIGHVGIYIGNGQFLHNSPSMDGVGISSLTSGYWDTHYVTARRVL
jgi:cell wall-associated NlpC family hydrolase